MIAPPSQKGECNGSQRARLIHLTTTVHLKRGCTSTPTSLGNQTAPLQMRNKNKTKKDPHSGDSSSDLHSRKMVPAQRYEKTHNNRHKMDKTKGQPKRPNWATLNGRPDKVSSQKVSSWKGRFAKMESEWIENTGQQQGRRKASKIKTTIMSGANNT